MTTKTPEPHGCPHWCTRQHKPADDQPVIHSRLIGEAEGMTVALIRTYRLPGGPHVVINHCAVLSLVDAKSVAAVLAQLGHADLAALTNVAINTEEK